MNHPYKTFETDRLQLRPVAPDEDAEFIFSLLTMPKWTQYIGDRGVKTLEEANEYICIRMMPQLEKLGFGNYTVIRKSDQMKLGTVGLYDREGVEGVDIGYAFLPEFEGQGYAFESCEKIKNAAFDDFNLTSINAITDKQNESSQKLLNKLGFAFQKRIVLPNETKEVMLFSYNRHI